MHSIGIDLHKRMMVVAVFGDDREPRGTKTLSCSDVGRIRSFFEGLVPFRAVIEASSSYRWLYDLLSPLGEVILAHPHRLRAIWAGRAKTDKLDAEVLARLLLADMIPESYVPPKSYAQLRDLTRARARLSRRRTEAMNELHGYLTRANLHVPYKNAFCKRGVQWIQAQQLGWAADSVRDELLRRMEHYEREIARLDEILRGIAPSFPETAALTDIHGVGLYTALLVVAEIAQPGRFPNGRKVGAYAGLTARVDQSGDRVYYGHITRQGSPWLRWALVQVAIHAVRRDTKLAKMYTRIRKRSGAKVARVAVARKLATICWIRLRRWHQAHAA